MARPNTEGDVRRVSGAIRDRASRWVRAIVLEGDRRIRLRTPVDKGRARGNWNLSAGTPNFATSERKVRHGAGGPSASQVQAVVGDARSRIYVVNGLPYIGRLEYGSSTQAPNGMVRVTAAELRQVAAALANRIRRG